jgi:hypothetical protein
MSFSELFKHLGDLFILPAPSNGELKRIGKELVLLLLLRLLRLLLVLLLLLLLLLLLPALLKAILTLHRVPGNPSRERDVSRRRFRGRWWKLRV